MIRPRVAILLVEELDDPGEPVVRDLLRLAEEHDVEMFLRKFLHRGRDGEPVLLCDLVDAAERSVPVHAFAAGLRERSDRALLDGEVLVRDDEFRIEFERDPESGTARAGTLGIVEGEMARGEFRERDAARLAEEEVLVFELAFLVDEERHLAVADAERRLERIEDAFLVRLRPVEREPVDDDFEKALPRIARLRLVHGHERPADTDTDVSPFGYE